MVILLYIGKTPCVSIYSLPEWLNYLPLKEKKKREYENKVKLPEGLEFSLQLDLFKQF